MYLRFADEVVVVIKLKPDDIHGDMDRGENHESAARMLRRRTEQDRVESLSI